MFLGYQNGKISFVAETREELESLPCVTLDEIEETNEEFEEYNGEFILKSEKDRLYHQKICLDVRNKRNELLLLTDSKMLPDYPITDEVREQYKSYRQYLRDIPLDASFPNMGVLSFEEWNV